MRSVASVAVGAQAIQAMAASAMQMQMSQTSAPMVDPPAPPTEGLADKESVGNVLSQAVDSLHFKDALPDDGEGDHDDAEMQLQLEDSRLRRLEAGLVNLLESR